MPILVRDPWRYQYFEAVECPDDVIIPIDDIDAWVLYPRERKVYDRLFVALAQGASAGPHGTVPPCFPVFSKPIVNLKGMGIGSRIIHDQLEYQHSYEAGHFWMPVWDGPHVSTDCAVINGEIHWMRHATGAPFRDGMFLYWTIHASPMPDVRELLRQFIRQNLPTYCGMVNFETIGGNIIEIHLRFADQWCDLYGKQWMQALVGLYRDKIWTGVDDALRDGFSVPLFADVHQRYDVPAAGVQDRIRAMRCVSSLQITFDPEKASEDHAQPPGGMRLALVNGWSLDVCFEAIDIIARSFPAENLVRPEVASYHAALDM